MTEKRIASYEFKNDYFYLVFRQTPEYGQKTFVLCAGINMSRFDPICWGKAGICSNPAFKGLQQLRADISAYCNKIGKKTRSAENFSCEPITPPVGTGWYRETPLIIEQATPADIRKMLEFGARDLVQTVLTVCAPDARIPAKLPSSAETQKFLDALNIKNFRDAAPSPISKPDGRKTDSRDH